MSKKETLKYYDTISADYIASIIASGDRVELHHIDESLKKRDPQRYRKFLKDDVVPISQTEHLRLHKLNKPHTAKHISKIQDSLNETSRTHRLRDYIIEITFPNGEKAYSCNGTQAARMIGCSRQQVYQVLSDRDCFKHYKTACGCTLRLLDFVKEFVPEIGRKTLDTLKGKTK